MEKEPKNFILHTAPAKPLPLMRINLWYFQKKIVLSAHHNNVMKCDDMYIGYGTKEENLPERK